MLHSNSRNLNSFYQAYQNLQMPELDDLLQNQPAQLWRLLHNLKFLLHAVSAVPGKAYASSARRLHFVCDRFVLGTAAETLGVGVAAVTEHSPNECHMPWQATMKVGASTPPTGATASSASTSQSFHQQRCARQT
jgi:hypothetical protein